MPQPRLLVGTKKAAFIYTADARRETWTVSDPIYTGWSVYHMAADTRGGDVRLYAAANHWAWGPSVAKSTDLGKTWDFRSTGLAFAKASGKVTQNVWNVRPGHEREPGVVYAGTQPAGLFRSEDWGHNWAPVGGLNDGQYAASWGPAGGGESSLHSIEIDPRDPKRMYTAVSSGGSYVTEDGGDTWKIFSHAAIVRNKAGVEFTTEIAKLFPDAPRPDDMDPLAIDEMHKLWIDPKNPDRLWTQTHVGVFRSDDRGATFDDVTSGLPSFHGFPIAVTHRAPDAAYVVPLAFAGINDNFRVCPGQLTVYRTRDGGKSWQPLTDGLPGPHDFQSAYREGLDTDGLDPEGVYVGTSNGQVYGSADGGDHWQRLPGTLPPILSVTCAVF